MENIEKQKNYFNKLSEMNESLEYNSNDVTDRILDEIIKLMPNKQGKILEIGSGTGQYTLGLLKRGYSVDANDISESSLDILLKKAKNLNLENQLEILKGDLCQIRNISSDYDYIVFVDTFHHLEYEQTIEILKILSKNKKTVRLVAYEPNGRYPFWKYMNIINKDFIWEYELNITHCTYELFKLKFKKAGWSKVKIKNYRILPFFILNSHPVFEIVDRLLMKISMISKRSTYLIIDAEI
jgi:SAM-dependent methyltransferase